ncbi:MAG TPA: dihydrolipoyl dehydrogenase [Bdellovibrionota bacterium]|nr:dihydrolipoyl dehydrogenase [Bdellovibrionota bacterium]
MANAPMKKDVVVIGGGPGGYVAAIRLGQLGKSVALVEKEQVGGVCLNWGCIPSKALIHIAKLYEEMKNAEEIGITCKNIAIDLKKAQAWKIGVVKKLTTGVSQLCKGLGVEILKGTADFETPNRVSVKGSNGGAQTVEFTNAIVATGSRPIEIPGFKIDGKQVVDSKDALDWTEAPNRILIVGGGVIGMEIGMLYQKFGTKVTVVEMLDQLLPGTDADIAQFLMIACRKREITVHLSSKALGWEKKKDGLHVNVETPKGKVNVVCDVILLSVGRSPNGKGVGLERIGVRVDAKGAIPVNQKLQTSLPHIFAIGDVVGPPLLAHKASKEGLVAAEVIGGKPEVYDVQAMPAAVFTDPEIATVGMSEEDAKRKGYSTFTGKFPFAASGRAVSTGATEGFVKVVAEKGTNLLLGVQIMGPSAADLISEATLAIEMGASVEDLALTVHPHPTLSESVMEAAEAAHGKAIHTVNRTPSQVTRAHGTV